MAGLEYVLRLTTENNPVNPQCRIRVPSNSVIKAGQFCEVSTYKILNIDSGLADTSLLRTPCGVQINCRYYGLSAIKGVDCVLYYGILSIMGNWETWCKDNTQFRDIKLGTKIKSQERKAHVQHLKSKWW